MDHGLLRKLRSGDSGTRPPGARADWGNRARCSSRAAPTATRARVRIPRFLRCAWGGYRLEIRLYSLAYWGIRGRRAILVHWNKLIFPYGSNCRNLCAREPIPQAWSVFDSGSSVCRLLPDLRFRSGELSSSGDLLRGGYRIVHPVRRLVYGYGDANRPVNAGIYGLYVGGSSVQHVAGRQLSDRGAILAESPFAFYCRRRSGDDGATLQACDDGDRFGYGPGGVDEPDARQYYAGPAADERRQRQVFESERSGAGAVDRLAVLAVPGAES